MTDKARRIFTHGWLGDALSIFTGGYYSGSENSIILVCDWCIGDVLVFMWLIGDE